jgi:hypothetical protein
MSFFGFFLNAEVGNLGLLVVSVFSEQKKTPHQFPRPQNYHVNQRKQN